MIKKYKQFVNEGINKSKKILENLREEWVDEIMNVSLEQRLTESYSGLCKSKNVPKEDYLNFQNYMDNKGFDLLVIKDLFSKEADQITGKNIIDVIDKTLLDNQNGHIDTYLYFTLKELGADTKKFELGGHRWGSSYNEENEAMIRYSYGYHKTKYGQLFMEQIGLTQDEFKKEAYKLIASELYDSWSEIIRQITNDEWRVRTEQKTYLNYKNWLITEEDRIIVFTEKLLNAINKESNKTIEKKEIDDKLINFFSGFDFTDFDITDNEFVINCESSKEYFLNY